MSGEEIRSGGFTGVPDWLWFGGFCFPVLPQLAYHADGPDKEKPDRLFIEDRSGRFLLYFEEGMTVPEQPLHLPADYGTVQIQAGNKNVTLFYPLQKEKPEVTVGYFSIRFSESPKRCCGNLSIRLPVPYCIGVKEYRELHTLLRALRGKGGDGQP